MVKRKNGFVARANRPHRPSPVGDRCRLKTRAVALAALREPEELTIRVRVNSAAKEGELRVPNKEKK